jgi:hypothetical protein
MCQGIDDNDRAGAVLFDAADDQTEQVRTYGAGGDRDDAAALKTAYASGLCRREVCGLDVPDLRRNPEGAGLREVSVHCSCVGASPLRVARRSAGLYSRVPEMDWIMAVLEQYPYRGPVAVLVPARSLNKAFHIAREAVDLDLACDFIRCCIFT